jgi:hypothetical protein
MHIEFLRTYTDPDTKEILGHQGERVHVVTSVGENLCWRHIAAKIRPASYVERLKAAGDEFAVAQKPAHTEWGIHRGSTNGEITITARCSGCNAQFRYSGPASKYMTFAVRNIPSKLIDPEKLEFSHCRMERIPADTLKRYSSEKNGESIAVTPDMGIFHKIVNFVGDSGKKANPQWSNDNDGRTK